MFASLTDQYAIAHRGFSKRNPENTMVAFEDALNYPVWGMELDLQLTADGEIVIFHDHDLRRMVGSLAPVCDLTLAEMKELNLSAWFGGDHPPQQVLTLDALLDQFAARTNLLLEVKVNDKAQDPLHHHKLMETALHKVREHRAEQRCAMLCFDFDLLQFGHNINAHVPMVWNQRHARRADGDDFIAAYSVDFVGLSQAFVEVAHLAGKPVLTFTVNQGETLKQALAAGVNGVMSDDPQWLCNALGVRA